VNSHNQQIKVFEEVIIDFMAKHPIYETNRLDVFKDRSSYAGFFILAVTEMLKYAIKEDYENQMTELKIIPIQFEYIKPS
jgi:hypothetical protein